MKPARRHIENAIERLIGILDELDGDPDFEPEPFEEQHDNEDDPAELGIADKASLAFVLAALSSRNRR
ncbi:hypothetical protein [Mesorhizobium sp. DCY119]|uniref:hypothetical protein n=1 Tax=Mesorhizobium sp. DCY119 TaxID=2108445 RepID=UPI000E6D2A41|nr:hypothetical protein [Mesorhizobium sp. DCY119]RJG46649.1 hypothetical protein D3Y55_21930 [Mesorhizobium sp. DCY119]